MFPGSCLIVSTWPVAAFRKVSTGAKRARTLALAIALLMAACSAPTHTQTPPPRPTPVAPASAGSYIVVEQLLHAQHGWVRNETGSRVTADGGASWQPAAWDDRVQDPYFVDAEHGWNFGVPVATRTVDGGRTWIQVTLPKGITDTDRVPYFLDPLHGYLLAHAQAGVPLTNTILATVDGGKSWTSRRAKVPPSDGVFWERRIYFFDARHGFLEIRGLRPTPLYRTADGGVTWQPVPLERPASASAASVGAAPFPIGARVFGATDAVIGRAWVDIPSNESEVTAIYTTHDAGQSWPLSAAQAGSGPIAILGPAHWLFAATSALRETTDAGQSWHDLVAANLPQPARWLDFADDQHGWAGVGTAICLGMGPCPVLQLYGTSDGGQSWQQLRP